MTCQKCNKLILERGVSYGINPNAVCTCETPVRTAPVEADKQLRLRANTPEEK